MKMVILTGPPAAGKNTIATILAKKWRPCAVIDADLVRLMAHEPFVVPWAGQEGQMQQHLGIRNTCALARNFWEAGWNVLILDVLNNETIQRYQSELAQFHPKIVLLLPTLDAIQRRELERGRGPRLKPDELALLYEWQAKLTGYHLKLDNSDLAASVVAEWLAGNI